jgi:hypothetical protein
MSTLPNLEQELLLAAQRTANMRPRWHRTLVLAISGVALCAGGATAVAQLTQTPSSVGTPIAPVAGPAPVSHLSEAQSQLDALRQPVATTTALPPQLQSAIRDVTVAGENPALGRKALVASFGATFWVVPAADGKVCLLNDGGGGGCSPLGQIADGTFSTMAPCAKGGVVHAGMLPNDAAGAALLLEDGSRRSVSITNNVWAIQIQFGQPQPTTLTWTQNGSQQKAPIGAIPPPVPGASSTCGP